MKWMIAIAGLATLAAPAPALADPPALRVPGGDVPPSAYAISDVEVEPPAKRTEGAATMRLTLTPKRPGLVLRKMEGHLLYAGRGLGGSDVFRRDAPQPRDLPKGSTRYAGNPATARLGCMDALQPRQLIVIEYEEAGVKRSESALVPFTWVDLFPTLDGRCHIPGR